MIKQQTRKPLVQKRHRSIRVKISGTSEFPRLAVYRSTKHIYAQLIDDVNHVTQHHQMIKILKKNYHTVVTLKQLKLLVKQLLKKLKKLVLNVLYSTVVDSYIMVELQH